MKKYRFVDGEIVTDHESYSPIYARKKRSLDASVLVFIRKINPPTQHPPQQEKHDDQETNRR